MSPVRPVEGAHLGPDWRAFSDSIRFGRAEGRCECDGRCGWARCLAHPASGWDRCNAVHGEPHPRTGSKVVLTVAHLTHDPRDREHVLALCMGCHLAYDREHHAQTRAARKAARA